MVPLVERNYNLVELGPRGTGKSHLFQQISPYAHLISGGKATLAKMFVNNSTGQRGLVCLYDVVCFDEISGISFDQKDGINIMKGYMESGEFSRGKESIRADGSLALVGNFEVDVEHQQRIGHLFGPMPKEMRDDTAFMDRIHAFLPGWDVPKISKEYLTDHFGLVSDFLSECWTQLRYQSRVSALQNRLLFGGALSGRDINAVNKTTSGLLKLLYPGSESVIPDEDLEWAVSSLTILPAVGWPRPVVHRPFRILASGPRLALLGLLVGRAVLAAVVCRAGAHACALAWARVSAWACCLVGWEAGRA